MEMMDLKALKVLLISLVVGISSAVNVTSYPNTAVNVTYLRGAPCGGNLTQLSGEFFSPQYPNNYPNNAECTWKVMASRQQIVHLNFTFVDLEICCDSILVYDGPSDAYQLLGRLPQNNISFFNSSTNYLTVVFSSDHIVTQRGFRAEWVFTEAQHQHSCFGNCGNNLGLCSCSNDCRYNGSCCFDFYEVCNGSTPDGNATGGLLCGGNLTESRGEFFSPQYPNNYPNDARCTWTLLASRQQIIHLNFRYVDLESCCDSIRVYDGPSDSYRLLGRLPQDNIYFFNSSTNYLTVVFSSDSSVSKRGFRAEWVFTDPVPTCGGSLFDSGSFSSPNYPYYYNNNDYCVWNLFAPAGQRIFLTFADLKLENCCDCDYVDIYDGPSTTAPLLAHVCFNNTAKQDFHSSVSSMTVLFRSNKLVVAPGFTAFFISSLTEDTGHVNCSSDTMTIVIRRSYLESMGFSWQNLYVDDHSCRPSATYYHVIFTFPLDKCGTLSEIKNTRVIYTNHVRVAQVHLGEIMRQNQHFLLGVECHMERETSTGMLYKADEITNSTITGVGRFNASMDFYTTSSFIYPVQDFPYEVSLNQYLYIQVRLSRTDNNLDLFLDTCVASPNQDFQNRTYDLLRNGCIQDNTVYVYTNGQHYYAQFRFQAFKFLQAHSYVYLQCKLVVCADSDYNSRCRQGCLRRRKRALDSNYRTVTVMLGPITLKDAKAASKLMETVV